MSLSVQQLNSDCTFLFAFSPACTTNHPDHSFNILLDPWLAGQSSVLHPIFQYTKHTEKPHITSLADLEQKLDLIIISQDKPDHCHRETLCTLPRTQRVKILTTPASAKKIKSWKYFAEDLIHVIPAYDAKRDEESTLSIKLPAHTSSSAESEGEITITHLPPSRSDLTKVHNGIAITYRPPGTIPPSLQQQQQQQQQQQPQPSSARDLDDGDAPQPITTPTLSILFTPHGLSPTTLQPYITTHLLPRTATDTNPPPTLTLLIHSLSHDRNPPCLGGSVVHGAPGGLEILRLLQNLRVSVGCWIGAHDGPVERGGWSVKWLKSRSYGVGEVQAWVDEEGLGTRVRALGGGEDCEVG